MKKFLLALLCAALCACARPSPSPELQGGAEALWQKMASFQAPGEFKDQFSMRSGTEGDTRRVTGLLWGDAGRIRLDILAGVGAPIAKILAQGDHFLLYLPQKQIAYTHDGPSSPWFKLGVPIPLDLQKLAALMNGDFAAVFRPAGPAIAAKGGYAFPVAAPEGSDLNGDLTVNGNGQPVIWEASKGGWTLTAAYDGEAREPKSLRLVNSNGQRAIILIKERDANPKFTEDQLALPLPAGTRQKPLADLKQGKIQF